MPSRVWKRSLSQHDPLIVQGTPRGKSPRGRVLPYGWPKWPVICHGKTKIDAYDRETGEIRKPKGSPCKGLAVIGSNFCANHGGKALNEKTRMQRYLVWILSGKTFEDAPKSSSAVLNILIMGELEAILDGRRADIKPSARTAILLAAFNSGIIDRP